MRDTCAPSLAIEENNRLQSREYICRCHTTFFFICSMLDKTLHRNIPLIVVVRAFIPIYVFLSALCSRHSEWKLQISFFFFVPIVRSFGFYCSTVLPSAFCVEPLPVKYETKKKNINTNKKEIYYFFRWRESVCVCRSPETIAYRRNEECCSFLSKSAKKSKIESEITTNKNATSDSE